MRTAAWKATRAGVLAALALACSSCAVPDDHPSSTPRLVVLIVVDQLRHDVVDRYRSHYVPGGFARFLRDGARYTEARYLHANNETGPGHAVISTGTWPRDNGIVANRWVEGGRETNCDSATLAERRRKLLRPTIADAFRRDYGGKAKILAASSKACAAQLLAAASGPGAYWQNPRGEFVTWQERGIHLPDWAQRFNVAGGVYSAPYRAWTRLLPPAAYTGLGPDDQPGEQGVDGRRSFPHAPVGDNWLSSPIADELLAGFAIEAIRAERLGEDDVTDFLALSFSGSDRVGHRFGPDSHEHMDAIVRLDRQLARLLDEIDNRVGLDRTLVVLTADHGMAPTPEVSRRHGWAPAALRVSERAVAGVVETAMTARYGRVTKGRWVAFNDFPNLYLDPAVLAQMRVDPTEAARVARDAVAGHDGVRRAYARADLARLTSNGPRTRVQQAALLSFRPDRSGDVVYQLGFGDVATLTGSAHGSHWNYDARVPLMWLGLGIRPGRYTQPASPVDIAPTLFALLGIDDPGTSGRVLGEMLADPPRDRANAAR